MKRILLIDDIAQVRQSLRDILLPAMSAMDQLSFLLKSSDLPPPEFEIEEAGQGEQGVEIIRRATTDGRPFDIAIVDMRMPPGIDGAETIRRIRQIDPGLHIIICTAHQDSDMQGTEGLNGQYPPRIDKPFEAGHVLQAVRSAKRLS